MAAIKAVFGDSHVNEKLIIGWVKSSVGHLESCAALIGILKTVEALERGKIPPQMLFRNPNPKSTLTIFRFQRSFWTGH
jgi:acyl transferase domain-containing protein